MNERAGLLDDLSARMNCAYISELRFLSREERKCLIREICRISPEDFPLREWNDALAYLANAGSRASAAEAKSELLGTLKSFR